MWITNHIAVQWSWTLRSGGVSLSLENIPVYISIEPGRVGGTKINASWCICIDMAQHVVDIHFGRCSMCVCAQCIYVKYLCLPYFTLMLTHSCANGFVNLVLSKQHRDIYLRIHPANALRIRMRCTTCRNSMLWQHMREWYSDIVDPFYNNAFAREFAIALSTTQKYVDIDMDYNDDAVCVCVSIFLFDFGGAPPFWITTALKTRRQAAACVWRPKCKCICSI